VTFHHPAVLAKRAAAVDHISGGRAVLGIGAGWQVNEHQSTRVELPAPGERVTRFAEAIEMIAGMLRDDRTTTQGSWFKATNLPAQPRPVQQRLPILVGTASPRMARLAAQWADEWNTWGHPDEAERMRGLLPADRAVVGSAGEVAAAVGRYIELGFDELIVPDFTFGNSEARRAEGFDRFWNEVVSQF
jgi:alkanesulfonate monooxygenase SsuD/methylene tetrahydromethanopterin reductase-like flavin-dependent oxidoreductase (luciferase family)